MSLSTGYENRKARIEIVPFIDIVFLLLTFFIYAMVSMTMYRGLRVQLPAGAGISEKPESVVITISENGELSMDGNRVSLGEAVAETAERVKGTDKPVLVRGDKRSELGVAVELLSALRRADVEAVSFQVEEKQ